MSEKKSLFATIKKRTKSLVQTVSFQTKQPQNVQCFEVGVNTSTLDLKDTKTNPVPQDCSQEINKMYANDKKIEQIKTEYNELVVLINNFITIYYSSNNIIEKLKLYIEKKYNSSKDKYYKEQINLLLLFCWLVEIIPYNNKITIDLIERCKKFISANKTFTILKEELKDDDFNKKLKKIDDKFNELITLFKNGNLTKVEIEKDEKDKNKLLRCKLVLHLYFDNNLYTKYVENIEIELKNIIQTETEKLKDLNKFDYAHFINNLKLDIVSTDLSFVIKMLNTINNIEQKYKYAITMEHEYNDYSWWRKWTGMGMKTSEKFTEYGKSVNDSIYASHNVESFYECKKKELLNKIYDNLNRVKDYFEQTSTRDENYENYRKNIFFKYLDDAEKTKTAIKTAIDSIISYDIPYTKETVIKREKKLNNLIENLRGIRDYFNCFEKEEYNQYVLTPFYKIYAFKKTDKYECDKSDKEFMLHKFVTLLETLENYIDKVLPKMGGAPPKPLKKSKECIIISGKKYPIYLGPRGGKYIKKDKKYVSVRSM